MSHLGFTYDYIELILWVAAGFTLLSVLGIASIIARRVVQSTVDGLLNRYRQLFMRWIISAIHSQLNGDSETYGQYLKKIRVQVSTRFQKQILIKVIQNYLKNLSGAYNESLTMLYLDLGLEAFTMKKLRMNNPYRVIEGIREASDFNIDLSEGEVTALLYSKYDQVREAALFILFDRHHVVFSALLADQRSLSEWQKLLIYAQMEETDPAAAPDFSSALDTGILNNKIFLIEMIGSLKLDGYYIRLLNMLAVEQPIVQWKIINAIVAFKRPDAIPFLEKLIEISDDPRIIKLSHRALEKLYREHPHGSQDTTDYHYLNIAS